MPNVRLNSDLIADIEDYNSSTAKNIEIEGDILKIFFDKQISKKVTTESIEKIKEYLNDLIYQKKLLDNFLKEIGF